MHYERNYIVKWTWRYLDKKYCYSECKYFDTESEANHFFFGLFHDSNIEIVWCQKICEETWNKRG